MPVIYMDRASAESLTEKDIREIIDENLMDLKYGMLTDYYVGQHRILSETKKDSIFLIITMSRIITWSWLNSAASVGAALKCYILMRTRRSVLQRWHRLI